MRVLLLLVISATCALSAAVEAFTIAASPIPGFLTFAPDGDAKRSVEISASTIQEVRADGRGCIVFCWVGGQRMEFPTRTLVQQLAALIAQARR